MDKKSMGTFLTDLRKEKGLTQQEVADNLNVSNKTISKWERDEGYPEITMLPEIAKFYGITTDELLQGKRIPKNETTETVVEQKNEFPEKSKTFLIVSATLNIVSFIVFFVFCQITNYVMMPQQIIYAFLSCTLLSIVSFVISKTLFEQSSKKQKVVTQGIIRLFCLSHFFCMTNVFTTIMLYLNERLDILMRVDAYIPFALLLSIVIIYKSFYKLLKNNNLYNVSLENEKNKRKLSRVSKVLISLGFVGSVIYAFLESKSAYMYGSDEIETFVIVLQLGVTVVSIASICLIGIMVWIYNKKKI